MNALQSHDPTPMLVPLIELMPSPTNPRKHFDPQKLADLAASIRQHGILQPLLVRPHPCTDLIARYEVVAGERRFRAATEAQLDSVPVLVRVLDDATVLEMQMLENIQRDELTAIEEADGYRRLNQEFSMPIEDICFKMQKKRGYVYARLKLLDLCEEAKVRLDEGTLDASKALLVARLPTEKLQKSALKLIFNMGGNSASYKRVAESMQRELLQDFGKARFGLDDTSYFQMVKVRRGVEEPLSLPACVDCPSNSHNDPELQAAMGDAHVCTNQPCFGTKTVMFFERQRRDAEAAGAKVLTGAEAKAAIPGMYQDHNHTLLNLGARAALQFPEPEPEDTETQDWEEWCKREAAWKPPTYGELLKDAGLEVTLAQEGKGELVELVDVRQAAKALKKHGVKLYIQNPLTADDAEHKDDQAEAREREAEQQKQATERTFRLALLNEVKAKWKGPLKRDDLASLIVLFDEIGGANDDLVDFYGADLPDLKKANERDLSCFLILQTISNCAFYTNHNAAPLLALAKRLRIDPTKIKRAVAAELKAAAKAAKQS